MTERGGIVITGASTGIGEACAVGLAQRGYRVYAGVRKDEDKQRLAAEGGHGMVPITLDVTQQDTIDAAVDTVQVDLKEAGLPLLGLFNNAGISVNGPLEFVSPDDLRWQFEVNCVGQLMVTQAFLPLLRESQGRIVSTGSVGGFVTTPLLGPYCMSKYAMEAFTDALRLELAPQGIQVVLIEPAAVATKIWEKGVADSEAFLENAPPELEERYGAYLAGIQKFAEEGRTTAASPQVVLDAVIDALEAPKPRTRYIMGTRAGQRRFLRMLPDRLRDRVLFKAFGIT